MMFEHSKPLEIDAIFARHDILLRLASRLEAMLVVADEQRATIQRLSVAYAEAQARLDEDREREDAMRNAVREVLSEAASAHRMHSSLHIAILRLRKVFHSQAELYRVRNQGASNV